MNTVNVTTRGTVGQRTVRMNRQQTVPEKKTAVQPDKEDTGVSKGKAPVSVEFSEEGLALSNKKDAEKEMSSWQKMLEAKKQEARSLSQMRQKMNNAGKKKKSSTGALSKALAIARRIMRGDKVPPKDESFLFRYNSDLYLKAKMMAMQNEAPEKHKSLLDEENEEGSAGSVSSPAPSQSASSEGTGESGGSESQSPDSSDE